MNDGFGGAPERHPATVTSSPIAMIPFMPIPFSFSELKF